jgi:phenylalanine-4-hydroxylase
MHAIQKIPLHLQPFIAKQDPSLYTPIDHASWRFIMKLSKAFFSKHAYKVYLEGLEATGIHTERIPLISEMDEKLKKFGWRAVPIVGFIPPAPFMEFLSLGILPIACDMRKIEHIHYTPAPDIVHEAAGHAPILADAAFANYLRSYGELARRVILTSKDEALYNAIRKLSDLKENPNTTKEEIELAQKEYEQAYADLDELSENIMLTRMGWWTFEYGLIGSLDNPKIYGAGLLSSVGESYHCLDSQVKKLPFSVDVIYQNFDITKPQPQLFVTPDFQTLNIELEKLAQMLAYRRGGLESLEKALRAKTVNTVELESGVQISGKLVEIIKTSNDEVLYLRFEGPSQLAYKDEELKGHGPNYHKDGYGLALGVVKNTGGKTLAELSLDDLKRFGFDYDKKGELEIETINSYKNGSSSKESKVKITGKLKDILRRDYRTLIVSFIDCKVTFQDRVLFDPSWGVYDLACGSMVKSVFGGAADRGAYMMETTGMISFKNTQSSNLTNENKRLNELYGRVRDIRLLISGHFPFEYEKELESIVEELDEKYKNDWLLRYELLEINKKNNLNAKWEEKVKKRIWEIASQSKDIYELVQRGFELL